VIAWGLNALKKKNQEEETGGPPGAERIKDQKIIGLGGKKCRGVGGSTIGGENGAKCQRESVHEGGIDLGGARRSVCAKNTASQS